MEIEAKKELWYAPTMRATNPALYLLKLFLENLICIALTILKIMLCAVVPITVGAVDSDGFCNFQVGKKNAPAFGADVSSHAVNHVLHPSFVSRAEKVCFFSYDFCALEMHRSHLRISFICHCVKFSKIIVQYPEE
jgi:hypothetical protein